MRVKDAVGRFGEQVACDHLQDAGFVIIERNWRCSAGEIDAIALDGRTLVVIEVKTRSSARFGSPLEAVDRSKQARLRRLAVLWMAAETGAPRPIWAAVRFDVVAVIRPPGGGRLEITHIPGAF